MKQTPQMKKIEANMQPGVITLSGFLGGDDRDLASIIEADNAVVMRQGLTHEQIAARMEELSKEGLKGLGEFIKIESGFEVKVDSVRGKLPCPFGHPGIFAKVNTTVRNIKLDREITYTLLNSHLIGEHGFYEGKDSPFRLEPRDLIEILEIESGE